MSEQRRGPSEKLRGPSVGVWSLSQEVLEFELEALAAGPLSFERLFLEVESLEESSDGPWSFRA